MGRPIAGATLHDELKQAIGRILAAAKKNGKVCGIYCVSGEHARMCAAQGFQFISITGDVFAIPAFLGQQLKAAKGTAE
ncbi:hypothetical protein FRB95_009974 [Tulasnella sp. JGI-2019a]|nr:hypothetical protein FRB95_009974 [Tulasnella sp. JGI-2019a]